MKIGYARVSTEDQNLSLQIDALEKFGCDRVFREKVSGVSKNRKEFENMLLHIRSGDTVVVWKLDRLGRSVKQLIDLMEFWLNEGIAFHSISDGLTINDSAMSRMFYTIIAAFAQLERDLISERTKAGLAEARKRGRIGGRPKGMSEDAKEKARTIFQLHSTLIMKEEQRKSVLKLMREAKESKDDQRVKDIREAIICLGDSNRDRMAIAWDLSNFLQGGLAEGKAFGCICKSAKI